MKPLQSAIENGKLKVTKGWITCPVCKRNKKLQRVPSDFEATNFPAFCPSCKYESLLNIKAGQNVELIEVRDTRRGQSVERRSP